MTLLEEQHRKVKEGKQKETPPAPVADDESLSQADEEALRKAIEESMKGTGDGQASGTAQ